MAISLALLIIVTATLPGISFSLSSSITSYNNSITFQESDSIIDLYSDSDCQNPWTKAAFDGTVIPLEKKEDSNKNTYYNIKESTWTMGLSSNVFLYIDGTQSNYLVKIKPSSSGSDTFKPTSIQISLGDAIRSEITSWDDATTDGISLSVENKVPYKVTVTMHFPTDKNVTSTTELGFNWGLSFSTNVGGIDHTASNNGNNVSFMVPSSSIDGIFIDSGELKKSGNDYLITNGGKKDQFGTGTVKVTTDGEHPFVIQLIFKKENISSFRITVTDSNGGTTITYNGSEYIKQNGYIGSNKEFSTTLNNNVKPFDSAVTITIEGDQHDNGNGNGAIQLKLIMMTATSGQQSG